MGPAWPASHKSPLARQLQPQVTPHLVKRLGAIPLPRAHFRRQRQVLKLAWKRACCSGVQLWITHAVPPEGNSPADTIWKHLPPSRRARQGKKGISSSLQGGCAAHLTTPALPGWPSTPFFFIFTSLIQKGILNTNPSVKRPLLILIALPS